MSCDREDILMISKELEEIAKNEDIKCTISYMQGVARGIQLERNRKFEPVINAMGDAINKLGS